MANLPYGGMKSLGVCLEQPGYGSEKIHAAYDIVSQRKFGRELSNPQRFDVKPDADGVVEHLDLNIRQVTATNTSHLLDLFLDFDQDVGVDAIVSLMKDNNYKALPPPLNEKSPVEYGYTLQLNMHKRANQKWSFLKWYTFTEKQPVSRIKSQLVHGEALEPGWTSPASVHHVKKVLYYLFERLPGTSMLYWNWACEQERVRRQNTTDESSRAAGYAFIREKGPRANNWNQFVEWTECGLIWRSTIQRHPFMGGRKGESRNRWVIIQKALSAPKHLSVGPFPYENSILKYWMTL